MTLVGFFFPAVPSDGVAWQFPVTASACEAAFGCALARISMPWSILNARHPGRKRWPVIYFLEPGGRNGNPGFRASPRNAWQAPSLSVRGLQNDRE